MKIHITKYKGDRHEYIINLVNGSDPFIEYRFDPFVSNIMNGPNDIDLIKSFLGKEINVDIEMFSSSPSFDSSHSYGCYLLTNKGESEMQRYVDFMKKEAFDAKK